jgi:hypothetical protein
MPQMSLLERECRRRRGHDAASWMALAPSFVDGARAEDVSGDYREGPAFLMLAATASRPLGVRGEVP